LNKEKAIQQLELKKQTQAKNYFIAGLMLFTILAFVLYRNYHNRQQVKVLTLRNKIASDLHDDIGSTLSSISIFSQMVQAQSKDVIPELVTIGESSKRMLDAMSDIVWTINPENDQFEKVITRMRGFAYELLGAKDIDFDFEADEDVANIKLSMEARKNLFLIFKEATNNLVKYAEANKAQFALKEENDKLMMLIRDNGKGFDARKEMTGNGLKNMKKRAAEMGAQLWIDSAPGNGTTIKLELVV
jgi:signal transduction histidine kinase